MAKGGSRQESEGRRQPDRSGNVGEDHNGGLPLTPTHPNAVSITLEQPGKKKRHTAHQIQQMEAMFLECSHPDHMQRLKLSEKLRLTPEQVLFWFQNRRNMMKVQKEREETKALLEENERMRAENNRLRAAMRNMSCPSCGNPAKPRGASPEGQCLRLENACLREQVEKVSRTLSMYGILPAQPFNGRRYAEPPHRAVSSRADVIDVSATSPPSFEKVGTPDEFSG